ncbi:hypothetical protein AHF37_12640 [Paragonimus kellicotti]|nr:hypothetical protein AHF37_12640 [Paragonimus kellicotti]
MRVDRRQYAHSVDRKFTHVTLNGRGISCILVEMQIKLRPYTLIPFDSTEQVLYSTIRTKST